MSFSENLRTIRKEQNISQEDLAEMMNVSRQAVSKWEQGTGYPETEKMILLSEKLNVSLDYLLRDKKDFAEPQKTAANLTGKIMIKSLDTDVIVSCHKVFISPLFNRLFKATPDVPQYALFGIDTVTFWGENRTLLGWYADKESADKEQHAIMEALQNGDVSYELQYAAKVKKGLMSVKLDTEEH
ncbi:helix-turn-helix domain-containing protein [Bariatricus massiliensis]|uniref:Helix-turn-helix domain-containing protein n=1 Tax=Bariatricus massiliensis TaxID=1745713 RepID=A0ABS8DHM3_9FIRM|nr:helix-turn-helix transcriptional regulator [Bariatricus massiliensis]MCB7304553.1 helix-turn-helix domain-containing protein [Bariatricus massiliensis]MCB7375205.1 helix-turn-helix domain-containing protein [Bariatricus massiliensis]MCB7387664.1 helix-turn-helix domain-containing protein [Bariatricus massiliensis]MCB7411825.1 helix-turn-helix domain-containing protein [Bariatricus massiliensis]MCQ5253961.1 helix-turn-helix domain-containing protein [Bariatricus massiliensis]